MFIFDFVAETILDQILDWIYGKIIGFLNDFFVMMNNMGVELFELPWVNAVTTFFSYLGWALFGVGLVVGAFECAIEYQGGRGSIKDTAMNYIKGFMAVSLFTVVPVNLYSLCVSLQGTFGSAITGITNAESIGLTAQQVLMSASFPGIGNPILMTFCAGQKNNIRMPALIRQNIRIPSTDAAYIKRLALLISSGSTGRIGSPIVGFSYNFPK